MLFRRCALLLLTPQERTRETEARVRALDGGELAKKAGLTVVASIGDGWSVKGRGGILREGDLGTSDALWTALRERDDVFPVLAASNRLEPTSVRTLAERRRREAEGSDCSPVPILPLSAFGDLEPPARRGPFDLYSGGDLRTHVERQLRGADGPILLVGETGTGKTESAHWIHDATRAGKPMRVVNCAALQENDRESFFRGVTSGHFTGVGESKSVFVQCDGGTVLLDDFQDLAPHHQGALLDLLEPFGTSVSGHALGADRPWTADVQVIVAVNRPLDELLRQKTLRQDIYYRIPRRLDLPPLRAVLKGAAADACNNYFRSMVFRMQERAVRLHARSSLGPAIRVTDGFRKVLGLVEGPSGFFESVIRGGYSQAMPIPESFLAHSWPGNFRELESVARRLLALGQIGSWEMGLAEEILTTTLSLLDAAGAIRGDAGRQPETASPRELIALAYLRAISAPGATLASAATSLDLDRRTLRSRLLQSLEQSQGGALLRSLGPADREMFVASVHRLIPRHS